MSNNNEKRLGVDISEDLWWRLQDLIPWGHRKHLYEALTRQLVELLEEADRPTVVVAMVLDDQITAQDLLERAQRQANEAERSEDVDLGDGRTRGASPGAGAEGSAEKGLREEG